jgi:hypothetical protein
MAKSLIVEDKHVFPLRNEFPNLAPVLMATSSYLGKRAFLDIIWTLAKLPLTVP